MVANLCAIEIEVRPTEAFAIASCTICNVIHTRQSPHTPVFSYPFAFSIQRTRCLIEQEYLRFAHECSRNGDPLLLPA